MWQRLCEILEKGQRAPVIVVGDFMLDRYLYGDAERISPEAPVPVLRVVREEEALGGAGSVAADLAALGASAYCIGVTGEDADADRLVDLLAEAGADGDGLVRVANRPTTRKTRLVGLAQHRHRQQLIRVDAESTDALDAPTVDRLLGLLRQRLGAARVLCIEDYNKGVVSAELARGAIEAARSRGVPVLVDPASIADYGRYRGATLVTPNRSETEMLIAAPLRSIDAVRAAAAEILSRCGTEHVCVTLDADGAALIGPDGAFEHVGTKKRDVYDVTGAGDEVLAALAVAVAGGASLAEAVQLANVAGGLEVEKFGCVPITRDEVVAEILREHHAALGKRRTLEQLLPELKQRRARGERIVFTNGCFDLIHAGHVATFAFAREQGDVVIVGVNSDASVRRLNKESGRPIVGEEDRARVLAAMADIDYVVIFEEQTPEALIEAIRPDVLVKGRDWAEKGVVGQSIVERNGGRVALAPLVEGRSTTSIIELIRNFSE